MKVRLSQVGCIPEGCRMIAKHECGEDQLSMDRDTDHVSLQYSQKRDLIFFLAFVQMFLTFEPDRTFGDSTPNPQHQQCRNHSDPEHCAPAKIRMGIENRI